LSGSKKVTRSWFVLDYEHFAQHDILLTPNCPSASLSESLQERTRRRNKESLDHLDDVVDWLEQQREKPMHLEFGGAVIEVFVH
jgi:hypothetical protein